MERTRFETDKGIDLLLEEVRARYEAEAERYSQLYNRIGVFLAVLAIYASVLVRFFEVLPPAEPKWAWWTFFIGAILLALLTVIGFSLLLTSLLGKRFGYSARPEEWRVKYQEYEEYVRNSFKCEGCDYPTDDEVDQRVGAELKAALISTLSGATEPNIQMNGKRYAQLYRASYAIAMAFIPLVVCTATYAFLEWRAAERPSRIQIVDPVEVKADTRSGPLRVDATGSSIRTDASGSAIKVDDTAGPIKVDASGSRVRVDSGRK